MDITDLKSNIKLNNEKPTLSGKKATIDFDEYMMNLE